MELGGNRQKIFIHLIVHVNCRGNCQSAVLYNLFVKAIRSKEISQNSVKDLGQYLITCIRDIDNVEMSHEPGCQMSSSSSWRRCCTYQPIVLNSLLVKHRPIINMSIVNQLPEQLNRRLRPILLDHGHVNIIHKNKARFTTFGSNKFFASFVFKF